MLILAVALKYLNSKLTSIGLHLHGSPIARLGTLLLEVFFFFSPWFVTHMGPLKHFGSVPGAATLGNSANLHKSKMAAIGGSGK